MATGFSMPAQQKTLKRGLFAECLFFFGVETVGLFFLFVIVFAFHFSGLCPFFLFFICILFQLVFQIVICSSFNIVFGEDRVHLVVHYNGSWQHGKKNRGVIFSRQTIL